jgi:hypothetical protein
MSCLHLPAPVSPSHLRPLSEQGQGQVWARRQSIKPKPPSTSPVSQAKVKPDRRLSTSSSDLRATPRPESLVLPPLRPLLRLSLRLRDSDGVLEDGRGPCLDSRLSSSRRPSVVLASQMAATGGSARPKRRRRMRMRMRAREGGTLQLERGWGQDVTHTRPSLYCLSSHSMSGFLVTIPA